MGPENFSKGILFQDLLPTLNKILLEFERKFSAELSKMHSTCLEEIFKEKK